MKVRFLKDGESPDTGPFKKGEVRDLDPKLERLFIKRGVAELSSAKKSKEKKGEEVKDDE
jgi:hypothetical protein